jgi:ribosomal protein S18 acetylase RimI-like enzyme
MTTAAADVAAIERATLAAVPPQALEEVDGWLLGLDRGTVGRACSAVPLAHVAAAPGVHEQIADRYRAAGLPPMFRIAREPCFDELRRRLAAAGFAGAKPTLVQVGTVQGMARSDAGAEVKLEDHPDEGWCATFLGEGFDPIDAASRLGILRRARESVFASAWVHGQVVAVGSACFSHGWCGVHGMRTLPGWRGRGLAGAVLAAFAQEAARRGAERSFLQVEEANAAAQAVYRRAGFATAWSYEYWRR